MNILSAHRGNDTGGTGWRIAEAFRGEAPAWVFRSACNPDAVLNYLSYPQDLSWDWDVILEYWSSAHVFHARNDWSTYNRLPGDRPAVIHYHGTNFRTLSAQRLREQREHRAQGLVSTLDLWLIAPDELEWLPSPYDLAWLRSLSSR